MDNLLVILRKPPYGTVNAAEAVRHAGGASGFDYKATLYLIDSGVYTAKKNQAVGDTGFSGVGESLELLVTELHIAAVVQAQSARRTGDKSKSRASRDGSTMDYRERRVLSDGCAG